MAMSTETLFDLLDLYTEHRSATIVGRDHNLNTFLDIRIVLNLEASANQYPRYAQSIMENPVDNDKNYLATYSTPNNYGSGPKSLLNFREDASEYQQSTASAKNPNRFQNGTVRYILDPERARKEKRAMASFSGFVEEDISEAEVKRPVKKGCEQGGERDGEERRGRGGERKSYRRKV